MTTEAPPLSLEQAALVAQLTPAVKPSKPTLLKPTPYQTPTVPAVASPDKYFFPAGAISSSSAQPRIAIIGGPGSGKTTSCLTFPHRIWLDLDNKLPRGEQSLPFWDSRFCDSLAKRTYANVVNRRDAFKFWLRDNHHKFHEEQTLITDSWTFLMNAFELQTRAEDDHLDANDKSNKYYMHAARLRYCRELFEYFRACRCTVVITFHESLDRDEKGDLNGKIRPVMDGQFKDQIFGHFTDVWRQRSNLFEVDASGIVKRDPTTKQKLIKSINHNNNPNWVWFWQLLGDAEFDTNCNPDLGEKVRKHKKYLVAADWNEIQNIYKLP